MSRLRSALAFAMGSVILFDAAHAATPVGNSFSFQGQLREDGLPATGAYDFRFKLYDSDSGTTRIGPIIVVDDHTVSSGLFELELDFGAGVFGEDARWLSIAVRPGAGTGAYTDLDPLQELLPTPFSHSTRGLVVDTDGNLDVDGDIHTSAKVLASTFSSTSPFIMEAPEGSERARIDDITGRFGIGETAPLAKLHVQSGNVPSVSTSLASFEDDVLIEGNLPWLSLYGDAAGGVAAGMTLGESTGNATYKWSIYSRTIGNSGDLNFTYGTDLSPTVNPRVMQLQPDGDVGIGITPTARLHIYDETEESYVPPIVLRLSSQYPTGAMGTPTNRRLDFAGTEIRAVDPDQGVFTTLALNALGGNVVIGRTNPPPDGVKLHVQASRIDNGVGNSAGLEDVIISDAASAWLGLYSDSVGGVGSGITFTEKTGLGSRNKWAIYARTQSNVGDLVVTHGTESNPTANEVMLRIDPDGTTKVKVLEITGADLAERFPATEQGQPGMVMAIDPQNPGKLCLARGAYNRCVAGVVSGAGDFPVGAILGSSPGSEESPVIALSGRVWVHCDASERAIQPGDLLTTASRPGYAMAVSDYARATGTMIGKAMTGLVLGETGLVLVLVNLQ